MSRIPTAPGVQILGPVTPEQASVLSVPAQAFVAQLHRCAAAACRRRLAAAPAAALPPCRRQLQHEPRPRHRRSGPRTASLAPRTPAAGRRRAARLPTPLPHPPHARQRSCFNPHRVALLRRRDERQLEIDAGRLPDFLPETAAVRADPAWRGAPPAPGLVDRRVEITGPVDRKMVINALNSGATQYMADFEGERALLGGALSGEGPQIPVSCAGQRLGEVQRGGGGSFGLAAQRCLSLPATQTPTRPRGSTTWTARCGDAG
jgi:hypothetical protein